MPRKRRICFVTGTRAEFGLMHSTLRAIQAHPNLQLQLIVTGMHLDPRHGKSIETIRKDGWKIDAVSPWPTAGNAPLDHARHTGAAISQLAATYKKLKSDVVLVVGDRIEAFAAASAGHICHIPVAHVHGGDRAQGQTDDALRHAITKLSHIHFPATQQSAGRVRKLGEDAWRIHRVGSPGIDGIVDDAESPEAIRARFPLLTPRRFALIVHHPVESTGDLEEKCADDLLTAIQDAGINQTVVVYPNSDPGSKNIIRCWRRRRNDITYLIKDLPRPAFLGLMRDSAFLAGNSSSGIIEAASFGTPVIDVGPRQLGRERGPNVTSVPYDTIRIRKAATQVWHNGKPRRHPARNLYGAGDTGRKIADILGRIDLDSRLLTKLIAY